MFFNILGMFFNEDEELKKKFEDQENKENKFIYKHGNSPYIFQEAFIQLRKDKLGNDINFNFNLPSLTNNSKKLQL